MLLLLDLLFVLPSVLAATSVRYFREPNCDTQQLDAYSSDVMTLEDHSCHIPPRNITRAISIDSLDDDCSIITYSDYACTPARARRTFANRGICFFSSRGGLLRSWRAVCGLELAQASASFASIRATQIRTNTDTNTGTGTRMTTTTPAVAPATITAIQHVLTTYTSVQTWRSGNETFYSTVVGTRTVDTATPRYTGAAGDRAATGGAFIAAAVAIGGMMVVL